ncbi:MAG: hypothetical protein ACE5F8_02600, partial [Woeseiaceae bacterium]
ITDPGPIDSGVGVLYVKFEPVAELWKQWYYYHSGRATLAESGWGITTTTWTYEMPELDGFYELRLEGHDVQPWPYHGSKTTPWNGMVDTAAPRLEPSFKWLSLPFGPTEVNCYVEDLNLDDKTFIGCPCPEDTWQRTYFHEISSWYSEVTTDTNRLVRITANCQVNGPLPSLFHYACDIYGHCNEATYPLDVPIPPTPTPWPPPDWGPTPTPTPEPTATPTPTPTPTPPPPLPLDSAVITPSHGTVFSTTTAFDVEGQAFAEDYLQTLTVTVGNQKIITTLGGTFEAVRRVHVETPVATHRAGKLVANDKAAVREIQPHLSVQPEIVFSRDNAAAAFDDCECFSLADAKRRKLGPFSRYSHANGIDRAQTFRCGYTQRVIRAKTPDLRFREARLCRWQGDFVHGARRSGKERNSPATRPNLHAQLAIGFEARRKLAADRNGYEPLGQHRAEQFLAHAAGHVDLQIRYEARRHVIPDQSVYLHLHGILRLCLAFALAEENAVGAHVRSRDTLAVDRQADDPALGRHAQVAGAIIPLESSRQAPATGTEAHGRAAVTFDDCRSLTVRAYPVGPIARAAGQGHPGVFGKYGPRLIEAPALFVDTYVQCAGPRTNEFAALSSTAIEVERALAIVAILQHPLPPILELVGHEHVSGQRRRRQQ